MDPADDPDGVFGFLAVAVSKVEVDVRDYALQVEALEGADRRAPQGVVSPLTERIPNTQY